MTALTFNDALTKYRSDQARDSKGRFADEGGGRGRGSARDPRLGLARSLGAEDLYRAVLSAKGGTAKENARIKLDRELARRVVALSPAERASLSARDKRTVTDKITPYMTARQRRTWELDMLDQARSRALDRTSAPGQRGSDRGAFDGLETAVASGEHPAIDAVLREIESDRRIRRADLQRFLRVPDTGRTRAQLMRDLFNWSREHVLNDALHRSQARAPL